MTCLRQQDLKVLFTYLNSLSSHHLLKLPVKSKIEMNGVTDKRDHTQTDHELEKCEFTIPITNLSNK